VTDTDLMARSSLPTMLSSRSSWKLKAGETHCSLLPVQYSDCWRADDSGVMLFRANMMQLGIKFTGRVHTRLVFRLGPLFAGHCRVEDVND
jgi:hypothetical protein